MRWLVTVVTQNGVHAGQMELAESGHVIVGRGPDCGIRLEDGAVSREHVAIHAEGGAVFVTDLSANGTFRNGSRLPKDSRQKIQDGDVIGLAGYELRVIGDAAPESLAASAPPSRILGHPVVAGALGFVRSFTMAERAFALVSFASLALVIVYWQI
jgi:predicted component of type VI protein secretion system